MPLLLTDGSRPLQKHHMLSTLGLDSRIATFDPRTKPRDRWKASNEVDISKAPDTTMTHFPLLVRQLRSIISYFLPRVLGAANSFLLLPTMPTACTAGVLFCPVCRSCKSASCVQCNVFSYPGICWRDCPVWLSKKAYRKIRPRYSQELAVRVGS